MAGVVPEYEYHPRGSDAWTPPKSAPAPGTRVRIAKESVDGTKLKRVAGSRHMADAGTGDYLGVARAGSLQRLTRDRQTISPTPHEDALMHSVWCDRRCS